MNYRGEEWEGPGLRLGRIVAQNTGREGTVQAENRRNEGLFRVGMWRALGLW